MSTTFVVISHLCLFADLRCRYEFVEDEELVKNISEPVQTRKIENIAGNEKEPFETNVKTVVNEELVKNISGPVQTQKTKPVQPTKNIDEKEPSETKIKTVVNENGDKESKNVSSINDLEARLELKLSHLLEKNENQTLAKINEILEKNVSLSIDFNDVKVDNKKQVREKNESESVTKLVVKLDDLLEKNENERLVHEKNETVSKDQVTIAENDLPQDLITKSNPKNDFKIPVIDNKESNEPNSSSLASNDAKSSPKAARPTKESEIESNATLKQNVLKVEIAEPKISPKLDSNDNDKEFKPKIDDDIDIEKSSMNNSQSPIPEEYNVLPKSNLSDYKNISILKPTKIENEESKIVNNHFFIVIMVVSAIIIPIIIGTTLYFCCKKSKKENQNIELGHMGNGNEEKAEVSNNTTESEL